MNPEDPAVVDFRSSCTRDEAVAKMLGWSKGHLFPHQVKITPFGIALEDLPNTRSIDNFLQHQLQGLRDAAQHALLDAAEKNASSEELERLEDKVREVDDLIHKAFGYNLAMAHELAKGTDSVLRVDPFATEETGKLHITLSSLDKWTTAQYEFSILQPTSERSATVASPQADIPATPRRPSASEDSVYVALGLLAELFVRDAKGNKCKRADGGINISNLAATILEYQQQVPPGAKLQGQGIDSLRKTLAEAEKRLKAKRSAR